MTSERNALFPPTVMPQPNVAPRSAVDRDAPLPMRADGFRAITQRRRKMIRAMTRTGRNDGSCDDALVGSHPYRPPITVIGATKASPPNETRCFRQRSCHNRTLHHGRRSIGMRPYRCVPMDFVRLPKGGATMIRAMTRTGRNDGSCDDALVGSHPYRPPITVIGATKASPPNETRFFRQRSCHNRTFEHGRRSIGMRPYRVTVRASAWPSAAANHPRPASRSRHRPRRRRRARPAPATPR